MFIRNKRNKSGIISVQVIDKSSGKYKLLKTIGSSADSAVVEKLVCKAEQWIKDKTGVVELDFTSELNATHKILDSIEQVTVQGSELLLGKIFTEIGFDKIPDELFRKLVIARLCFPASKLATTDYLYKYQYLQVMYKVYIDTWTSCIRNKRNWFKTLAMHIPLQYLRTTLASSFTM